MTSAARKHRRARQELMEYVRSISAGASISVPKLRTKIWKHFDDAFFCRLGREEAAAIAYIYAEDVLRPRTATNNLRKTLSRPGGGSNKTLTSVFSRFYEQVEPGTKVLVMEMVSSDLASAINLHDMAGDREHLYADWLRKLKSRLKKGERVKDRWTVAEVAQEYKRFLMQK